MRKSLARDFPLTYYGWRAKQRLSGERQFVRSQRALSEGTRRVDDEVISRIKNRTDVADFGQETYFGRKFFYYTKDASMLVITVPPPTGVPYGEGVGQPSEDSYPALPKVLSAIDETGSSMYRDAIVPIALAHEAAAYPIGVGTDVLKLAAREILGLEQ